MKTITIRNLNNTGLKIVATADVVENGEVVASHPVEARSKDEFDRTVANILDIANQVQSDFDAMAEGEWVAPVVEEPVADPTPEPTEEEIARDAWLEQWRVYEKANNAMKALADAGIEATPEEVTRFNALKKWVADNRKPEYSQFM